MRLQPSAPAWAPLPWAVVLLLRDIGSTGLRGISEPAQRRWTGCRSPSVSGPGDAKTDARSVPGLLPQGRDRAARPESSGNLHAAPGS